MRTLLALFLSLGLLGLAQADDTPAPSAVLGAVDAPLPLDQQLPDYRRSERPTTGSAKPTRSQHGKAAKAVHAGKHAKASASPSPQRASAHHSKKAASRKKR